MLTDPHRAWRVTNADGLILVDEILFLTIKKTITMKKENLDNGIKPDVTRLADKWAAVKKWLYEFWYGHPFLLEEEVEIIVQTRLYDRQYRWMNDIQIQELIKIRVREMYKKKFPNAKRCRLLPI